MMPNIIENIV